ncbi:unnamed protein product [Hermetia illucens]|uniref:Uncharacterized protein n=2 Tax=Hermetia illucens TaxID=343691 RepID=A0A7R8YZ81_HERIL|nr:unnamed protein product [Hermetia illucens]
MEMESKGNNVIDSLLRLGRMYVMFTDKQKMKIPDVKKGIKFGFLQAGISLQNGSAYDLSTVNRASNFVMVENKHTVLTGKFNFTKMEVTFQEFNVRFLLLNVKMGKVTVKLGPHLIPTKLVLAKDDSLAGYKLVSYDFELKMKSLAFQIVNKSPLISRVLSKFTQVILNLFIKLVSKVATKAVKDILKNTLKEF